MRDFGFDFGRDRGFGGRGNDDSNSLLRLVLGNNADGDLRAALSERADGSVRETIDLRGRVQDNFDLSQTATENEDGSVDVIQTLTGPRGNEGSRSVSVTENEDGSYSLTLDQARGLDNSVTISNNDGGGLSVDRVYTGPQGNTITRQADISQDGDTFVFSGTITGPRGETQSFENETDLSRLIERTGEQPSLEAADFAEAVLTRWGVDTDVPEIIGVLDTETDAVA